MSNDRLKFNAFLKKEKLIMPVKSIDFEARTVTLLTVAVNLSPDKALPKDAFGECMHDQVQKFDDVILLQFTSISDNNGVEVYEGDIVTYNGFVVKGIVRYGVYKRQPFMNGDKPKDNIGFYIKGIPEESKCGICNVHKYPLIQHAGVIKVGNIYTNWNSQEKIKK